MENVGLDRKEDLNEKNEWVKILNARLRPETSPELQDQNVRTTSMPKKAFSEAPSGFDKSFA